VSGADYTSVTEAPGDPLRAEALDMLAARYALAEERARGRRVLEAGCGPGQGLGLMNSAARFLVGGDYTRKLLAFAGQRYGARVPLVRLDAQSLPFVAGSFDLVVFYEAIYYLARPAAFVAECRRVLSPGGAVLLCTANRLVPDFNPSPYSVRYYSSEELRDMFESQGFAVTVLGAFRAAPSSLREGVVSIVKRAAVALDLVPRTMKGKALLKRLFFGPLQAAPAELVPGLSRLEVPVPIARGAADATHRVIYVIATLNPISTE
jgi:SAM-dependent methyltransferase